MKGTSKEEAFRNQNWYCPNTAVQVRKDEPEYHLRGSQQQTDDFSGAMQEREVIAGIKDLPVIGIEIHILPLHVVIQKSTITERRYAQDARNQQQDQKHQCKTGEIVEKMGSFKFSADCAYEKIIFLFAGEFDCGYYKNCNNSKW